MAASIPASLRSSGIVPFITRANQVEKVKPAVAYWCNYWVVQQIVTRGLHNSDEESKTFTERLMDKLEAVKTEHQDQDAITDEVAAKAYLEQFGLEVFDRADSAIRNNKSSKQTADTFQAAYTFLEVLNIWPPLEPEIATKIKFAKYHALRIAKAIKSGEDPNLSNPPQDSTPIAGVASLDPKDPEVEALGGLASPQSGRQPSIEEVPDEHHQQSPDLARASSLDQSLHPSRAPSAPPPGAGANAPPSQATPIDNTAEGFYQHSRGSELSPLAPSTHERANSEGGGYFPRISQTPPGPSAPSASSPQPAQDKVLAPGASASPSAPLPISPVQPSPTRPFPPQGAPYYPPQPPAQAPDYIVPNQISPPPAPQFQPMQPVSFPPPQPQQPMWSVPQPDRYPVAQPPPPPAQDGNYITDDEAVAKAQKHARWAISALNFEDVKTAVRELRSALETLGAR